MPWVSLSPGLCHGPESPGSDAVLSSGDVWRVLRGTGRQKLGAVANAVGYYTIGFPIGISLMFAARMGVLGTCAPSWYGLSCAGQSLIPGTRAHILL